MSTFDDPNREAIGLEPIWTGAEPDAAPKDDELGEPQPEPDPEPASGRRRRGTPDEPPPEPAAAGE
jgi:hypothetical protein